MKRTHRPFLLLLPPPLLHLRRIIYPGVTSKKGSLSTPSRIPYETLNTRKSQDTNGFSVTVPKIRKLGNEIVSCCNSCCRRSFRAKTQKSPHESQFFLRTQRWDRETTVVSQLPPPPPTSQATTLLLSVSTADDASLRHSQCVVVLPVKRSSFSFPPPPPLVA